MTTDTGSRTNAIIQNLRDRKRSSGENAGNALRNYQPSISIPAIAEDSVLASSHDPVALPQSVMILANNLNLADLLYQLPPSSPTPSKERFAVTNVKHASSFAHTPAQENNELSLTLATA